MAVTGEPLTGDFSALQCPLRASVADGRFWPPQATTLPRQVTHH